MKVPRRLFVFFSIGVFFGIDAQDDSSTTALPDDNNTELEDSPDGTGPEVVQNSAAAIGSGHVSLWTKPKNKHLPVNIFDKFSPENWLGPFMEKVNEFVTLTKHPNFGGVQLWSPQHLWEKLHEKGHGYWTGPHGAVFGKVHPQKVDYPFAYRNSRKIDSSASFSSPSDYYSPSSSSFSDDKDFPLPALQNNEEVIN